MEGAHVVSAEYLLPLLPPLHLHLLVDLDLLVNSRVFLQGIQVVHEDPVLDRQRIDDSPSQQLPVRGLVCLLLCFLRIEEAGVEADVHEEIRHA